jgi:hypothetical protein
MNTYLIGYDLDKPGQVYKDLIDKIKSFGTWWHCLDSTWLIKSSLSAKAIRDTLNTIIDNNDKLLVARLSGEAAWTGFIADCSDWLKNNL